MKKRTKPKVFLGLLCTCKRSFSVFSLFLAVLLLCSASLLGQQTNRKTISFDFKDFSVLRALHEINRLGGNVVTFREEVVMKETKKITLKRENITVFEAIKVCLEGTGLVCSQQANGRILVGPKQEVKISQVSGRIVDEKGNPVPGATVVIQGTTQGVASDAEGNYTIPVKPDDILRVSFIGYKPEVVEVKGKTKLNIRLKPTEENLEEVTVVAFGEQKKESVVSAITTVKPMDLKSSNSDLTSSFAGKIAGMIGWQTGGIPGAMTEEEMNTKFYIRGITSFQTSANVDPLILIDGVESSKLDFKNNNESLALTNYGRPYTEDHEAVRTFTNVITKFYRVGSNLVFFMDQWNDNIIDIKLKYTDVQGDEIALPLKEMDFKENFITLENVSTLPTDSIFILREGKLEGCPDTIRFSPLVLGSAKTFTSEFESAIRQRYGFSNQTEAGKLDFDNFIDTVRVLEFDYDITSFEDVLYCPKLEKIVLGRNRYLYPDPKYGTKADSSILHDKSRSMKVLDKANELMGLKIERYGKHYCKNMAINYMTDLGYSTLPAINCIPVTEVDTIRCSIEDSRADKMLVNLLDDDPTTRWETTILSYLRSYTLTIELKEAKNIRGVKISQMLFDPQLDSESQYFLPPSIIVKTSMDQADWKNITYTEENMLGRGSGEVTLLPVAEGSREVRYIRVTVYDQMDGSAARVKLGDIVPFY